MSGAAPYRRIADEIRDRVARGELRPGDRVPSTRQITQQWGVAMATATKVIATLQAEGVVDTRPGAGTVVRQRAGGPPSAGARKARREPELGRDRIVRAAIAIADAEGLSVLSMRRVATDLGVATMSLYRHLAGRDELTVLMVDAVMAEKALPPHPPAGWRERLELAARTMWAIFHRHPWAAEVLSMTRPQMVPGLLRYAEWALSALRGLGLSPNDMMQTHIVLFGFVRSMALSLQSEAQAFQDTGLTNDEWMNAQEENMRRAVASGRFPTMQYVTRQEFDFDLDGLFEFGLARLLDGVAASLRQPPAAGGPETGRPRNAGTA
jgi:DNA-binding transcriptional regulator YhcF (GntR family)